MVVAGTWRVAADGSLGLADSVSDGNEGRVYTLHFTAWDSVSEWDGLQGRTVCWARLLGCVAIVF
jgi:hypothetical protein